MLDGKNKNMKTNLKVNAIGKWRDSLALKCFDIQDFKTGSRTWTNLSHVVGELREMAKQTGEDGVWAQKWIDWIYSNVILTLPTNINGEQ